MKFVRAVGLLLIVGALGGCTTTAKNMSSENSLNLNPCPASPNCVCSDDDGSHYIAPLTPATDLAAAWQGIESYLKGAKRVTIVSNTENYIHAEFHTALFRFVDDVEFLMKTDENIIAVRSASRVGYSDLGTNRRRIEHMRALLVEENILKE